LPPGLAMGMGRGPFEFNGERRAEAARGNRQNQKTAGHK
jgi:hypothetical protein